MAKKRAKRGMSSSAAASSATRVKIAAAARSVHRFIVSLSASRTRRRRIFQLETHESNREGRAPRFRDAEAAAIRRSSLIVWAVAGDPLLELRQVVGDVPPRGLRAHEYVESGLDAWVVVEKTRRHEVELAIP